MSKLSAHSRSRGVSHYGPAWHGPAPVAEQWQHRASPITAKAPRREGALPESLSPEPVFDMTGKALHCLCWATGAGQLSTFPLAPHPLSTHLGAELCCIASVAWQGQHRASSVTPKTPGGGRSWHPLIFSAGGKCLTCPALVMLLG